MNAAGVTIRRAGLDDAMRLALIGQATFLETFAGILDGDDILEHCAQQHSREYYARSCAGSDVGLWLAEAAPQRAPVGFVMISRCSLPVADVAADDLEIKRIYVLHRFHGAGVGAALMHTAIDAARSAGKRRLLLGVYAGNERAIAFYGKHGFRRVGERQFQVGARCYDDVVLALSLDSK